MNSNSKATEILQTFTVHKFLPENYELIKGWWEKREFPPAHFEHLPPTGFLVAYKGVPLACGFLFNTDAHIAVIGNFVSNPDVQKDLRQPAIDFLIEFLTSRAKDTGNTMVCCSTNLVGLGVRFENHKFVKTDTGVSMYARGI